MGHGGAAPATTLNAAPLPADQGAMTLIEHLAELRRRVIICAAAVVACAVVGWFLYPSLSSFLLRPYHQIAGNSLTGGEQLLANSPIDGFAVRIKITTYVGITLAMPVILFQLWRFVSPGLYKNERRWAAPFIASAVVLFVMGALIAYWT